MHHAPEIDVHQPVHLRLVDLVELAEQRNAGIVDDDVEAGMGGYRCLRERFDLAGIADIDAVDRHFTRMGLGDLGGDALQSRLVAIGQRQVGAAAASSSSSARPIPPAAPVTAAADPDIAVISGQLPRVKKVQTVLIAQSCTSSLIISGGNRTIHRLRS
jgi:hypothetical protein